MALWLMPRPEAMCGLFFSIRDDADLVPAVDALRPLRLDGTVPSALHLVNGVKVLQSVQQYPWDDMRGATPLSADVEARLCATWGCGAWNGSSAVYGTPRSVRDARDRVRRALRPMLSRFEPIDDARLALARRIAPAYRLVTGIDLAAVRGRLDPAYGLLKGETSGAFLASTHWRKRQPPPANPDPDHDGCGLIWLAPVAPIKGRAAREMADIVVDSFARHGFEPAMSMTMITPRALDNVVALAFDRDVPGEDARALACHDETLERLIARGYYPYRLSLAAMGTMHRAGDGTKAVHHALKTALDPHGIMAPGRYIP